MSIKTGQFFSICKRLWIVLGIFFLSFCRHDINYESINSPLYFDINSLIDRQIALLDSLRPVIEKRWTVNGLLEKKTQNKTNWTKELTLFRLADINAPALKETFIVKEEKTANSSVIKYTKKDEKDGIKKLVIRLDKFKKPIELQAFLSTENLLYSTSTRLVLKFFRNKSGVFLSSYSVSSTQKVLFKESVISRANSIIVYPF